MITMNALARFTAARAECLAYEAMTPAQREAERWNIIRSQIEFNIACVEYEFKCGARTSPGFCMTLDSSHRTGEFTHQIEALAATEGLEVEFHEQGLKFSWKWE